MNVISESSNHCAQEVCWIWMRITMLVRRRLHIRVRTISIKASKHERWDPKAVRERECNSNNPFPNNIYCWWSEQRVSTVDLVEMFVVWVGTLSQRDDLLIILCHADSTVGQNVNANDGRRWRWQRFWWAEQSCKLYIIDFEMFIQLYLNIMDQQNW